MQLDYFAKCLAIVGVNKLIFFSIAEMFWAFCLTRVLACWLSLTVEQLLDFNFRFLTDLTAALPATQQIVIYFK